MLAALKTPQRSILKAESGNSIVKKRRVIFASDDENGSDSSSSEMMEVEVKKILLIYDFKFEIMTAARILSSKIVMLKRIF